MMKDQSSSREPVLESAAELELLTRDDATQIVTDLVQLIEAKALAQRLAIRALVQEVSVPMGPEVAFRIHARLSAMRRETDILTEDEDSLHGKVVQELSLLLGELDSLVTRT